jgi:hypothetical protein
VNNAWLFAGPRALLPVVHFDNMNAQPELNTLTTEHLARIEEQIRLRLTGRVRDLHLVVLERGLVLRGQSHTYYAKQLAQQVVMATTELPIWANEIEVS